MRRIRAGNAAIALSSLLAALGIAGPLRADDPPGTPPVAPPASAQPPGAQAQIPPAPGTPALATPAPSTPAPNAQAGATAEALFEAGRVLMKEKKYGEACPKLYESMRIDPALGTMLYLADCYEKNGQTASAWSMFNDAATAAHNAGQNERELKAKLRVQNLAPKLVRLTLTLAPENAGVEGLEIKRDGISIGAALLGTAVPVDPGDHLIAVTAPGKVPWSGTVNVPSKARSVTAFVVPGLEDLPQLAPLVEPTASATASAAAVPTATAVVPAPAPLPTVVVVPDNGPLRTVGLVVAGAGIAGGIVASVLGFTAKSRNDEALQKYCEGQFCSDQKGVDLTKDAKTLALGSTIAFIIGGVTFVTGASMLIFPIVSKPSPTRAASPRVTSEVVVGPASLGVRGRF